MAALDVFGRRLRTVLTQLVLGLVFGYFCWSLIEGDRGLRAWAALETRLEETRAEIAALEAERARILHRVSRLRPDSLDPDLLEERARAVLNYGRPDELVILQGEPIPTSAAD